MTFRKFENETKEEWKKRHSEFANWAQLLREAVDHHGSQMTGNEVLYHGINRQMFFASTIALFDGPLSTTKNENIAFGIIKLYICFLLSPLHPSLNCMVMTM